MDKTNKKLIKKISDDIYKGFKNHKPPAYNPLQLTVTIKGKPVIVNFFDEPSLHDDIKDLFKDM